MRTYSLKYVELAEKHAEQMAKRWAADVQNNPKTPTYRSLNEQKIISQCIWFYHQFSKMFVGEKITEEAQKYFRSYAAESYAMGIPMAEAMYALTLMRRHLALCRFSNDFFFRHRLAAGDGNPEPNDCAFRLCDVRGNRTISEINEDRPDGF